MKRILLGVFICVFSFGAHAASYYQSGNIKNITATKKGIMIMLDSGLPDNCEGTPYGWMLIKQEHSALISVVLAAWVSGNKSGTVYTSGIEDGGSYCLVSQFDPAG